MERKRYEELHKALQKKEKAIARHTVAWGRKEGKARVERLHAEAETGGSFDDFLKVAAARSAVRFLLRTVYVRVLEDLGILPEPRIRGQRSYKAFRDLAPSLGYRAYLTWIFRDLAVDFPALFRPEPDELPMPGEELCREVWDLWHQEDGQGGLLYDWSQGGFDSRFLGDLYQDLDADVRKRYALLQTPDFVEEYILDHTLTPALGEFDPVALRERGEAFRVLDPTCGSGHFLVGAFHRMADFWQSRDFDPWAAVELALDSVWGCDINPYAVDIARFRLLLEVLQRTGEKDLARLSRLKLNLRAMDSLIPWEGVPRGQTGELFAGADRLAKYGTAEERAANATFLRRDFHVVVGNPPYIEAQDAGKKQDYRRFWPRSAIGRFGLAAPFIQRFFALPAAGAFAGQIVGNSFTKRSFGRGLIEGYLKTIDITDLIDTGAAYIPGHGTSTLIIFGRNRPPVKDTVRCIGAKRGERNIPDDPRNGRYWRAVVDAPEAPSEDSLYITVENYPRHWFFTHPWNLNGGGAPKLQRKLEKKSSYTLARKAQIGHFTKPVLDDIYIPAPPWLLRKGAAALPMVEGEFVRDWTLLDTDLCVAPVETEAPFGVAEFSTSHEAFRYFWRFRRLLWDRRSRATGFRPLSSIENAKFYEFPFYFPETLSGPQLAAAEVSTHAHVALDLEGRLYKQTAPCLKLREALDQQAQVEQLLHVQSLLMSSVGEFWSRQVFYPKGGDKAGEGARVWKEPWTDRLQRNAKQLGKFPITENDLALRQSFGREFNQLAEQRRKILPSHSLSQPIGGTLNDKLLQSRNALSFIISSLVALQEELDWLTYQSYGLLPRENAAWAPVSPEHAEPLAPGHRPFEIVLARHNAACDPEERSSWFSRHGHDETTEIPKRYSNKTRARIQARIDLIAQNKEIRLLEQPQFKRRWQMPDWDKEVKKACESWLLDRLEDLFAPPMTQEADSPASPPPLATPRPYTLEEIVAEWKRDPRVQAVADVYTGERHTDLALLAERLLDEHGIPDQPYRIFTDEGLRKLRQWQEIWRLQDREDAGEKVKIPRPPEFAKGDFKSERFLKIRGKLNVPRERFLVFAELLPPRYGWNGWRDMDRALAQVEAYTHVEQHPLEPLPTPTSDDPRRCGATIGLWESLPDVKRWVGASQEGELRALAEEACQQTSCPCEVVSAWQAWQAGTLQITVPEKAANDDEVTFDQRAEVLKRFNFDGNLSLKDLQSWWNRGPAELERILDVLVANGELVVKGKGARRRYRVNKPA